MITTSSQISAKSSPTFKTTRENICRLTCLLNVLSPQLCAASEHVSKNSLAKFYTHLAEILTVGDEGNADALAVTGGPLTAFSYDLSVGGSPASDAQDNELVNDFRILEIKLEGELDSGMHAESKVFNRIQSIFQKLGNPACDEGSFVQDSLVACAKKIKSRLMSDRFYLKLGARLTQIFVSWKPTGTYIPFEEGIWVRTQEALARSLEPNGIEARGPDGAKEFLLSNENLRLWLRIFAEALSRLELKAEQLIAGQCTGNVAEKFVHVHDALYGFSELFRRHPEIFDKTSLKETLLQNFKSPPKYLARSLDPDDDSEQAIDSPDHLPWLYDPRGKGVGAFILHHIRYILGCFISASAVFRKSRKFFGDSRHVRVYYVTAGSIPDGRCDYREILNEFFPAGHDTAFQEELISRLREEGKFQKTGTEESYVFTGKVHCEAALMTLSATKQTGKELGLDDSKLQVIKENRCSEKCCWCYHWLQNKLNSLEETGERFELPGTHGLVFPWAPPVGLDLQIWLELEKILKDKLKDVMRTRVEIEKSKASRLRPPQSSPPSSDDDGPGAEIGLPEVLMLNSEESP